MVKFIHITELIILLLLLNVFSTIAINDKSGISVNSTQKGGDFLSYNITNIEFETSLSGKRSAINIGDGLISNIWEDVVSFDATPFGVSGKIASVWGEKDVYFLISHDYTDFEWIAMQWDTDASADPENFDDADMKPMAEGDDLWFFGVSKNEDILGDGQTISTGSSDLYSQDAKNDLFWDRVFINDTEGNILSVAWEIRRELVTDDTAGADVIFSQDTNVSVMLASSRYHRPDTNLEVFKFSMTSGGIGGEAPVNSENSQVEGIDAQKIFNGYVATGLLYMFITMIFLFVPTYIIMKKEVN